MEPLWRGGDGHGGQSKRKYLVALLAVVVGLMFPEVLVLDGRVSMLYEVGSTGAIDENNGLQCVEYCLGILGNARCIHLWLPMWMM